MHNLITDVVGILKATLSLVLQRQVIWASTILGVIYFVILTLVFAAIIFVALVEAGDGPVAEYEQLALKYFFVTAALAFPLHFPVARFIEFAASDKPRPRFVRGFRITREVLTSAVLMHVYVLLSSGVLYSAYQWFGRDVADSNWFVLFVSTPAISLLTILFILPATTFAAHHPAGWSAAKRWLVEGGPAMYVTVLLLQLVIAAPLILPHDTIENFVSRLDSQNPEEALIALTAICLMAFVLSIAAFFIFLAFPSGYRYWLREKTNLG